MAGTPYVIVDVYRDGFFVRRETLGAQPGAAVVGSSTEARIWLDSTRVEAEHAALEIDQDGRLFVRDASRSGTFMGRRRIGREEVFRGAPLTIPPYVLVVTKRPFDPDPADPARHFPPLAPRPLPVPPLAPDPGPPDRACPRCVMPLATRTLPAGGPAYRTAPLQALSCTHCALLLVPADVLAARMPVPGRLAGTPAMRSRTRARGLCPTCRSDLQALALSWADTWASVEECSACGLVAFDLHELEAVERIVRALGPG